ncbi:hypothetical protein BH23GEM6_BH23GEM6_24210 [soil metagenome]
MSKGQQTRSRVKSVGMIALVMFLSLAVFVPLIHDGPLTWKIWLIYGAGPAAAVVLLSMWPRRWE